MPKWVKFLIGLVLLPVCVGAGKVLWALLTKTGSADMVWFPLLAGAAAWLSIYLLLPKPTWVYVLGHELTHAVWTLAFGGKVKKIKAGSKGGHVVITKNNCLITLAPYFFPFYAILVVAIFVVGDVIWGWHTYRVWFHILLGAAYAFHVTLTCHILKTEQSDITSQGLFFSMVLIFLGNAIVLLIALPLLTGSGHVLRVFGDVATETGWILRRLARLF
jgi:hypothetical protein